MLACRPVSQPSFDQLQFLHFFFFFFFFLLLLTRNVLSLSNISQHRRKRKEIWRSTRSFSFLFHIHLSIIISPQFRIKILELEYFSQETSIPCTHTHTHTHTYTRKARTRYTWLHEAVAKTSLYGVASFTSRSTIIILLGKISSSFNLLPLLRPGRGEDWRKEEQTDAVVSPSRSGIQINR